MEQTVSRLKPGFFEDDVIARLAHKTQESPTGISRALQQVVPLVTRTLVGRLSGPDGPETIWKLSREAYGASILDNLAGSDQDPWLARGEALMRGLLGDTFQFTELHVAAAAGIGTPAVACTLSAAAVAALGIAGEYAQEQGFDAAALAQWLQHQEATLRRLLLPPETLETPAAPAAVDLPEVPLGAGPSSPTGTWAPVGGGHTYTPTTAPAGASTGPRWSWGALLLAAVGLGYFFGHDDGQPVRPALAAPTATPPTTPAPASNPARQGRYDASSDTYIYDTGQPLILRLADGTTQKVGANSTENRLYTFLADPLQQVDSVNRTKGWINFDRVYFETAQTTLTDESFQQLRNVASILKTFPSAMVKIGGYTDSTGNPLKNFQLSEERAKVAMLALANLGIDVNRLQAKGYGGKFFITPNTTAEGRALNRRISIRVVRK